MTTDNQQQNTASNDKQPTEVDGDLWKPENDNPLEGFDPEDYKDGVEGDERYRVLDLYVGYLVGTPLGKDSLKLRLKVASWNRKNRPPLGDQVVRELVKSSMDKWRRYHYLHLTGDWAWIRERPELMKKHYENSANKQGLIDFKNKYHM